MSLRCLFLLVLITPIGVNAGDSKEIEKWLMKSDQAAKQISYRGTFVYTEGKNIESMQVVHKALAEGNVQRLFALNGEPREIIRDAEKVWCYLPNKKTGVHEYRQNTKQSFPYNLPEMIGELVNYYQFEIEQSPGRVVDRATKILQITPKDKHRYAYRLWLDYETGLLLRAAILSSDLSIIEQYMFTDIEITDAIPDAWLKPSTDKESLIWYGQDDASKENNLENKSRASWAARDLPMGFKLVKTLHRQSAMSKKWFDHYIYSDGLASVSVFIEDNTQSTRPVVASMSMGAVNVSISNRDGVRISAVGEVPESTVTMLADGMKLVTR